MHLSWGIRTYLFFMDVFSQRDWTEELQPSKTSPSAKLVGKFRSHLEGAGNNHLGFVSMWNNALKAPQVKIYEGFFHLGSLCLLSLIWPVCALTFCLMSTQKPSRHKDPPSTASWALDQPQHSDFPACSCTVPDGASQFLDLLPWLQQQRQTGFCGQGLLPPPGSPSNSMLLS